MTKHTTPSLDKDSASESKACDLVKFLDPEKETLFCFDLLRQDQGTIFSLIIYYYLISVCSSERLIFAARSRISQIGHKNENRMTTRE